MNTLLFHLSQRSVGSASFRPLSPEAKGPSIRQLQHDLNHRFTRLGVDDFICVRVDGWFGPKTVSGVKYLQCISGLPVNGQVSAPTQAFIQRGTAGLTKLSLGSTGLGVLALKQVLAIETEIELSQNDYFCQQTEWAVMAYQHKLGLRCDGIVGHKTWEAVVRSRLQGLPCAVLLPTDHP